MDKQKIFDNLEAYDPKFDREKITQALHFAEYYHRGQVRDSGDPYYHHPIEVAVIITEMHLDTSSVITALLHDIVEDTELTLQDIEQNFGAEVAKLVNGVTKLSKIQFVADHFKQAENFRKLLVAMSEDIRVLLVKLADRLHNMRTIDSIDSPEKRFRIALETIEIYAPLAERIGVQKIKVELQDLCFRILQPKIRNSILKTLQFVAKDEVQFINTTVNEITAVLIGKKIKAEVHGRRKTPYSIWMKMQQKKLDIEQLSDIVAFRIIVDKVATCYQVLGVIHTKYQMVPEHFQDFISTPKNNNYQSLHTVVIGPLNQKIEIQIRTQEMHEVAELGVAAHWQYKQKHEGGQERKQYRWIRELLDILKNNPDPEEFLQNTKLEMYYDQVFCFTPQGKLIALPKGATPIDFAYAVHSDIGHHCKGVKINGQMETLNAILKNGDQVEIIRSETQTPNPAWEKFVVTGKARSEIRRYLRTHQKSAYVTLGKVMLDKIFETLTIPDVSQALIDVCRIFNKEKTEDLYYDIAKGILTHEAIIKELQPKKNQFYSMLELLKLKKATKSGYFLPISGLVDGIAVRYAECCHPIPYDKIVGVIHIGTGITIHMKGCKTASHVVGDASTVINLIWDTEQKSQLNFVCRLKVAMMNEPGVLANFTAALAQEDINIANFKITARKNDVVECIVDIEVVNTQKVDYLVNHFKDRKFIYSIERVKI